LPLYLEAEGNSISITFFVSSTKILRSLIEPAWFPIATVDGLYDGKPAYPHTHTHKQAIASGKQNYNILMACLQKAFEEESRNDKHVFVSSVHRFWEKA
jgi:hypothetical protein